MADIALDVQSAPTTPASGVAIVYVDSSTKQLASKNDAGVVTPYGAASNLAFPITVTGVVSGGILYASSTTVVASSALLGANNLTLGGGVGNPPITDSNWTIEQTGHTLSSSTQPRASVTNSAAQSIPNVTETPLTFDTNIDAIPATIHNTATNTSRFVIPSGGAGYYCLVGSSGVIVANATGKRYGYWRKNGTTGIGPFVNYPLSSVANPSGFEVVMFATLAAGDYVEFLVYQDSGGSLNFGGSGGLGSGGAAFANVVKIW